MISSATLSTLGTPTVRDPAVRLVDALSRLSPAAATQSQPVSRLASPPSTPPTPVQGRTGRGALLDLSV